MSEQEETGHQKAEGDSSSQIQTSAHNLEHSDVHEIDPSEKTPSTYLEPEEDCNICLLPIERTYESSSKYIGEISCGHKYHTYCIRDWFQERIDLGQEPQCPIMLSG